MKDSNTNERKDEFSLCFRDKLDRLSEILDEDKFDFFHIEPGLDNARNRVIEDAEKNGIKDYEPTEKDIKRKYKKLCRKYHQMHKDLIELFLWGDNYEEIITSLRDHMKECPKCKIGYHLHILQGKVDFLGVIHNK